MKSETFNNSKSIIQGLKYIGNSLGRLSYSCEIDPETLFERLSIIADGAKWLIAIDKLANCQIVFTDVLTLELVEKIFDSNNVEDVVSHYYFDDETHEYECDNPNNGIEGTKAYAGANQQLEDPNSILNYAKNINLLRNSFKSIARGKLTALSSEDEKINEDTSKHPVATPTTA